MFFAVLILVLVLAAAFFQSLHGMFSALIMTVLTLCCAALAIGTYEWVAVNWVAPNWKGDYAEAVALASLFGVPLVALRLAADKLITRSALLPSWMDRAGAGVCGLVTAMVMVGVLAIAVQLLPFHNGAVLGYSRVVIHPTSKKEGDANPVPPDPEDGESELWLTPDRFAMVAGAMLSDGIFSGGRSFAADHPDAIQAIGWMNAAPATVTRYAPPGSIAIVNTEPLQAVYKCFRKGGRNPTNDCTPFDPEPGHTFQMIRVQLKKEALGSAKSHAFTLRQFRLVGTNRDDDRLAQYPAMAIQQEEDETPNRHIKLKQFGLYGDWPVSEMPYEPRMGNKGQVEIVFEIPDGFEPDYLEYKQGARVKVSFDGDVATDPTTSTTAPPGGSSSASGNGAGSGAGGGTTSVTTASSPTSSSGRSRSKRGGNVRRLTTRSGKSHFGDKLPTTLAAYRKLKNADIRRGVLVDGHLIAYLDEQDEGTDRIVRRFEVPDGKRMLHLNTDFLQARSGIGRILSSAVKTAQNYTLEDAQGRKYRSVGKYAIADVNGRQTLEIQYFSNPVGTIGGMGKFEEIRDSDLTGDYEFILLFLVEPGAKIVSFSTGGSASRRDDLAGEELVAPK